MLDQILAARVARNIPPVANVRVMVLDYGSRLGVAVTLTGGGRHAATVLIERDDLTKAADDAAEALRDWLQS
jgi:hypothetical protein